MFAGSNRHVLALLDKSNRGLLMDLAALAVNLLSVSVLQGLFVDVIREANDGGRGAMLTLFGCSIAMFVLAPIGATLKRWHYHRRLEGSKAAGLSGFPGGCLFNPIFYFCLIVVVFSAINAFLMQSIFGRREPSGAVFVPAMFIGLGLIITHTWLVYRFFSPPKQPPASAFMRSERSETIGDACLFANMMLYQLVWGMLTFAGLGRPGSVVDVLLRLFVLVFLALLLYFPPRMFYLAEDAGKPRTWLMILLANAPVIVRMLLGSPSGV